MKLNWEDLGSPKDRLQSGDCDFYALFCGDDSSSISAQITWRLMNISKQWQKKPGSRRTLNSFSSSPLYSNRSFTSRSSQSEDLFRVNCCSWIGIILIMIVITGAAQLNFIWTAWISLLGSFVNLIRVLIVGFSISVLYSLWIYVITRFLIYSYDYVHKV